jgi:hypothetical protein
MPKRDLTELLREIFNSGSIMENGDERYQEIRNMPEIEELELKTLKSGAEKSRSGLGQPSQRTPDTFRVTKDVQPMPKATEAPVAIVPPVTPVVPSSITAFRVDELKREMLVIIDELIQYYVSQKAYGEVARLTTFASETTMTCSYEPMRPQYKTPITLTTLLREKSPELLRPRTEQVVPPIPTWFEEYEKIMSSHLKQNKPKQAKNKKTKTRSKRQVKSKSPAVDRIIR